MPIVTRELRPQETEAHRAVLHYGARVDPAKIAGSRIDFASRAYVPSIVLANAHSNLSESRRDRVICSMQVPCTCRVDVRIAHVHAA